MTINSVYKEAIENDRFIKIWFGGAASGKSYAKAQEIVLKLLETDRNFLVIRKVGATLRDSVFALLRSVINDNDLEKVFSVNKSEFTITNLASGNQIICKGLDNPEKIKSITVKKGVITDIWLEEATELTETDFNQLLLRLRGKTDYKKQVHLTFNPISNLHWIKKRFFDNIDDTVYILKTTYKDNKFLDENDRLAIESLKDKDKVYYDIYALGEWGVLGNLVFTNWSVQDLSDKKDHFNAYHTGLDFGFSGDPTAIIKISYKDNTIYILDEFYQSNMTNADIASVYKQYFRGYVYCDSAEPKSIKELRLSGVSALPVKKGKDSVKHGIQWIRQKKIIIDIRCKNFVNEIQTYKYREDKDGNVLDQPIDMNNHLMDAMRYALEHIMIVQKNSGLTAGMFGL